MDPLHADIDHRKKRRNRTTHSCINCHTTKRKCDRKRPCQRCTQLGLTGLCVYEVDDPASPDDPNVDETTRLRKRIAELEGVIRELKNKPHPRWISQAHDAPSSFHTRSQHSRSESFSKKRKLGEHERPDVVDLSMLPDGGAGQSSSVAIKLEPHTADGEAFNIEAYDARYALPDAFGISPNYHSSSSPDQSDLSDSPRTRRHMRTPCSPSTCECLNNTVAFHSLTGLEVHLRGAINVLSNITHSPRNEAGPAGAEANPLDSCTLYAEIARLQDLIVASTRPATPMLHTQTPHQQRIPLSLQVPMTFSDSIQSGLPPGFNLRQPPPPPRQADGASLPGDKVAHVASGGSGIITPPLTSQTISAGPTSASYPWDSAQMHPPGYAHSSNSESPSPPQHAMRASPTLSSASSSFGSSHSFSVVSAPQIVPVTPIGPLDGGYTPYFAAPQHQSSHARYSSASVPPPVPETPATEYEGFSLDALAHHQPFGNMIRTSAGAY